MHILFIIYGSEEQVSGGYLYDRMVIEHLKSCGDTVHVLRLETKMLSFSARLLGRNAISETLSGDTRYDWIVVDKLAHLYAAPALEKVLSDKRETGETLPRIAVLVHMLHSLRSQTERDRKQHKKWETRLFALADLIITPSATTADAIKENFAPEIPVEVCKPGRDAPGPREEGIDELLGDRKNDHPTRVELLSTSNFVPGKGHHLLLQALEGLRTLPWSLTIAGDEQADPAYTAKIRKRILQSGFEDRIRLAGTLPVEQLGPLYRNADIFVFPTLYESYGISLAEALSFGLPFVAFDVGAVGEVGSLGSRISGPSTLQGASRWKETSGFLIRPGDVESFSHFLSLLISDRILREAMSRKAYENGEKLPLWQETRECFRDLLLR